MTSSFGGVVCEGGRFPEHRGTRTHPTLSKTVRIHRRPVLHGVEADFVPVRVDYLRVPTPGALRRGVSNRTPFAFSAAHERRKSPGRSSCIPDSPGSTGNEGSNVGMSQR